MKKSVLFYQIGSIAFILLGLLHIMAHFTAPEDTALNELLNNMQAFKIELFGEHNLLKFYLGFSLMMGCLLSAIGVLNLSYSKSINKISVYVNIVICSIAFIISFNYFHLLAYGSVLISLFSFCLCLILYKNQNS